MYLPLFINLAGKDVLVVGGGKIATRRALNLLKNGARVTVISKEFSEELKGKEIELVEKDLRGESISLSKYFLVVIATDDEEVNEKICRIAMDEGILVNRADNSKEGNVIFPVVSEIEGNLIAFTTLGKDPALSRKIREIIEKCCREQE
ncbi:MAG: bifunctional precorrin-2 dehydrogenase/sirohydrochlorin ferrochelatase [Candidatus Altiarchaeales archaeon]|nr:bifunctional precorrin-2 dehydrogenase/sirohydrochlorin ferrochelatase [Candidatus Altiarchaeota archaeon]MBU4341585.1 bifunctional precorrin-2 dehydrogenase/sirohydrochlorin ferrochelatase [Candidatus Altiarchaeota archaeon]MBU4406526.1 bifunctional precorrin-2 dehydrogenase/sirohydrochlorin ferrochelatase [Candidatus Altiarchaeota archaeon]MBU4436642.1 bifunctional precorrin-2 dehydrogenase/sirohydrochlorin ferrochelatase [Candidatus Altiarchaeota archaeon]MCG2783167.1 bifunctional precorr